MNNELIKKNKISSGAVKILLINPPFNIAKANYDSSVSVGLLSIGTYLAAKGFEVKIIDGARQKDFWSELEKEIPFTAYAGLSVMTTQLPGALRISVIIRKINFGCKIIWGGTHPTFFPGETVKHKLIDIVCYSEGEEVFRIYNALQQTDVQLRANATELLEHILPPRLTKPILGILEQDLYRENSTHFS